MTGSWQEVPQPWQSRDQAPGGHQKPRRLLLTPAVSLAGSLLTQAHPPFSTFTIKSFSVHSLSTSSRSVFYMPSVV